MLNNGVANALLKVCRDDANSFSSILPDICAQVNNAAAKLLKLAKADIVIQSARVSSSQHAANVLLKSHLIVFT